MPERTLPAREVAHVLNEVLKDLLGGKEPRTRMVKQVRRMLREAGFTATDGPPLETILIPRYGMSRYTRI